MTATEAPLDRFLQAQARDYEQALAELKAGKKRTHGIWYVLPQSRELGGSRPRLVDCVDALLSHPERDAWPLLDMQAFACI